MALEYGVFKPKKCESSAEWGTELKEKLATFSSLLKGGESGANDVQVFLIELVWAVLRGEVAVAQAVELVSKSQIPSKEPLQKIFADVLWLVGFVAIEQNKGEMRTEFDNFCAQLEQKSVMPRQTFAIALETESVPPAVCAVALLKKKHNQAKTKARYTITRYNLLREHTEGYSKLLTLLDRTSSLDWDPAPQAKEAEETRVSLADDVIRLAGFCHLCPNRILSMAIDFYERRLETPEPCTLARPLVDLMRRFPTKRITEVAVFQLLSHGPAPSTSSRVAQAPPPPAPARPSQFLAVAALAQQDLIDVEALWPYLEPSDAHIGQLYSTLIKKYEEEVEKCSTVDLSAGTGGKDKEEDFQKTLQNFNQAGDQKFLLAAALISVNHWDKAHKVLLHLRQFCKPVLNDHVRSALCDLLKWLLGPCLKPAQQRLPSKAKPTLDTSFHGVRRFGLGLERAAATSATAAGQNGSTVAEEKGSVPKALRPTAEFDKLLPQIRLVLEHLEYFLHTDMHVLSSLWRVLLLLVRQREKAGQPPADDTLLAIIYRHLLPAASLVMHNPHLSELMWNVISRFSVFQRFMVYSCWETMYDSFLLKLVQEKTRNSTKQILKRVVANAERRDLVAHGSNFHFCKLCHSNPIPAIEVMIRDIERGFNVNMIQPYVECTGRCSDMTADIMGYVLTRNCAKPASAGRTFLNQADAMLSSWLQNLGEFVGRFYKKHPTTDFNGLLTIITKRINSEGGTNGQAEFKGDSLIRVVLENLIEFVGGFSTVSDMNADQLLCLAGGPRLKSESIAYGKKEDAARKEKARQALLSALIDQGLVQVLWYSLSQQRSYFLSEQFSEAYSGSSGLKLLGLLFDGNHECFLKLTEFLVQSCPREKYFALLPPLQQVFSAFEPSSAFLMIRHGLPQFGKALSSSAAPNGNGNGSGGVKEPVLEELERVVRLYLPETFETDGLSVGLYNAFWRLSLADIFVPTEGYEKLMGQIMTGIKQMETQKKKMEYDRDHAHSREYKALKKDHARVQESYNKLKEEHLAQKYNHERVLARVEEEKAHWFIKPSPAATNAFVALMICPRVLMSHSDALFCCRFVRLLIRMKTPGFQLLDFYNSWTIMLTQCIRCCSEREAQIFGVFLREMMSYVLHLRGDEKAYNEEMKDNPCFHRNYYEDYSASTVEYAKFEDFKKGHMKWEGRVHKAVKQGLESEDWMEKRNALLLLSESISAFPAVEKYGKMVLQSVETMREKEEFSDLKTLAASLAIKLKHEKDRWLDKAPPTQASERKSGSGGGAAADDAHGGSTRTSSGRSKNALNDAEAAHAKSKSGGATLTEAAKTGESRDAEGGRGGDRARRDEGAAQDRRGDARPDVERPKDHHKEKDGKTRDRADSKAAREEARDGKEARERTTTVKESSRSKEPGEKQRSEKDRDHKSKSASGDKVASAQAKDASAEGPPPASGGSSRKRAASGSASAGANPAAGGGASAGERIITVSDDRPEKRRRVEREEGAGHSSSAHGSSRGQQARNALAPEPAAHHHHGAGRPPSPHGRHRSGGAGGHHASRGGHERRGR
eukprot:TRINITY_DN39834_c0_g1_i1.p1 TRINITY_DN39834_c0_g1~~TRINITY_DN39834_c0_g1_i1.p1  ORF type:complete len:1558 (+),score=409.12 TRINITY_DN39834_c0_g1_i1:147-4820(+)